MVFQFRALLGFIGVLVCQTSFGMGPGMWHDPMKERAARLGKYTLEQVQERSDWFIYRGVIYKVNYRQNGGSVPRGHNNYFTSLKKRPHAPSEITQMDLDYHPNESLEGYLRDFSNVIGVLDETSDLGSS